MEYDDVEMLKEEIEEIKEEINRLESGDNADEFEEYLNDSYGDVDVCGYKMASGTVLREMDTIAFDEALNNYNDGRLTELNYNLDNKEEEMKKLSEENRNI